MPKQLNLVVDYQTNAVLAFPVNTSTAVHVSAGILNTFNTTIPVELALVKNRISAFNLTTDLLQLTNEKDDEGNVKYLRHLPEHLVTEDIKSKRALAKLRSKYIYYQEVYYRKYLNRSIYTPNHTILPYLLHELDQCDSASETYSDGIKEYSQILGIPEKDAYDELTILTESAAIVKMRYFAWYIKNVSELNKLYTEEDMSEYSKSIWHNIIDEQEL
jgi:hypothetical protein